MNEALDATNTREIVNELRDIWAAIENWKDDVEAGLRPTMRSLSEASAQVKSIMRRLER